MAVRVFLTLLFMVCLGFGAHQVLGHSENVPFQVVAHDNGTYALGVNGVTWLPSGPTFFNNEGRKFCSHDGTLKLLGHKTTQGQDKFGQWQTKIFTYKAGNLTAQTSIKTYKDPALPLAVFSQRYIQAGTKTKGKHADDIISSFPSFRLPTDDAAGVDLGYLAYGNDMAGWVALSLGRWTGSKASFSTGIKGGPLVIFDKSSNAVVVSPLSQFMAASNRKFGKEHVSWGIMGLVDDVYADYSVDFIAYFSDRGVNQAMRGWGNYLTTFYNKPSVHRDNDLTLTHLGYWTDNGAYYYYHTEPLKSYEDTMLDVVSYLGKQELPIKYLQIDSWFYTKGHVDGTKTWEPKRSVFPHGFDGLYNRTGLPIGCHNRYWDSDNTYARYNGGKYHFIADKATGCAVPDDQQFWIDLFQSTGKWGKFILYEQDWMNAEQDRNYALLSDLDLGRRWLTQMGRGAALSNVTIQYCMAYSRHLLQSLEVSHVTQARASDDYQPGNKQWKIGITSMFVDAINIAPSKDTFWTSQVEPGNPYSRSEKTPYLQTLLATFSTGPVGPGDGIGHVNTSLLMRCCDSNGRILRASRPLTIMDKSLKQAAFEGTNTHGRDEVLYSTVTRLSDSAMFGTIVANELSNSYSLVPSDLSPDYPAYTTTGTAYLYSAPAAAAGQARFVEWSTDFPLRLDSKACGSNPCVFHSCPAFDLQHGHQLALLGEFGSKFSPVSPQRFSDLRADMTTGRLHVKARLSAREVVDVSFLIKVKGGIAVAKVRCNNSSGSGPVSATVWADVSGHSGCEL